MLRWFLGAATLLGLAGAWWVAPPSPRSVQPIPGPVYSPFVVTLQSEAPFSTISFKDVGMSINPESRAFVYEAIAQSVAAALESDPALPMSSEVLYSEEAAEASSHLACGVDHIYVDLWAPGGGRRWGYSLWSGCSEDDRFRLEETTRSHPEDVDPLAEDIARSLRSAVSRDCFTARC